MFILLSSKFLSIGNSFRFGWNLILEDSKNVTISPTTEHQFWVNLCNTRIWRHALYTYKQELINIIYICCEWLVFLFFLSGRLYKTIYPKFLSNKMCYHRKYLKRRIITTLLWDRILCQLLVKWAAKYSEFSSRILGGEHLGNVVPFFVCVCFQYFQRRSCHNICMWLLNKLHLRHSPPYEHTVPFFSQVSVVVCIYKIFWFQSLAEFTYQIFWYNFPNGKFHGRFNDKTYALINTKYDMHLKNKI